MTDTKKKEGETATVTKEGDGSSKSEIDNSDKRSSLASQGSKRRRSSLVRRSSLYLRARASFVRSGGNRGASVEVLRGTTGADFESMGYVKRGDGIAVGTCCGLFGSGSGDKDERKERFILVKGSSLFVFSSETSKSPKYAVDLAHKKPNVQDNGVVLLETSLGDVEYTFTFHADENKAQAFASAIDEQARKAEQDIARKRLGHEHLIDKRTSVRYAETVAQKKAQDQPEAPVTADEVLAAMPAGPL